MIDRNRVARGCAGGCAEGARRAGRTNPARSGCAGYVVAAQPQPRRWCSGGYAEAEEHSEFRATPPRIHRGYRWSLLGGILNSRNPLGAR